MPDAGGRFGCVRPRHQRIRSWSPGVGRNFSESLTRPGCYGYFCLLVDYIRIPSESRSLIARMARLACALVALFLVAAPLSEAFTPAVIGARLGLRSSAAARRARAAPAKMSLDSSVVDGAQAILAAVQNVPFTDELTGEAQGFTAPQNHFLSVRCCDCLERFAGKV